MPDTDVSALNHTLQETKEWLDALRDREPFAHEQQAYSNLRAVLHAVRDRLTVEEAVHLSAQLPMLVRGFYFEGWRPALAPKKDETTVADFLESVRENLRDNVSDDTDLRPPVTAVLTLLTERLSEGQIRHVRGQMPTGMQELWPA